MLIRETAGLNYSMVLPKIDKTQNDVTLFCIFLVPETAQCGGQQTVFPPGFSPLGALAGVMGPLASPYAAVMFLWS